jgi:serine/threonine protein kinase/phage FluMu protein Com
VFTQHVTCPSCQKVFLGQVAEKSMDISCPHCQKVFPFQMKSVVADPEDIFSTDTVVAPDAGPLSMKGIKVGPRITLTLGDFQVLKKLGSGGMGAVYLARQLSQDRPVALKILGQKVADMEKYVARFYREALALATLNHPNIVTFYGVGREKGLPFLAMEFIEGLSTATIVANKGKLAIGDALYIILRCADALEYAYGQELIHRDIKPENIMLNNLGYVKIADLGLAKSIHEDLNLTESGVTLGSPRFMAPEQGRNAKYADQRSDIFALGGVLYYLLTGEFPFQGETPMELMLAKEEGRYLPARRHNPLVPPRLDLLLDKMLAKLPARRYQDYKDLRKDLESLGLAHPHLSFNIRHVLPLEGLVPADDPLEILIIDDDLQNIVLAQQALEEHHIPGNINIVHSAQEAQLFLHRQGNFTHAPLPNLIVLGSNLHDPVCLSLLKEIQGHEQLKTIPLVVLALTTDMQFLKDQGIQVSLIVKRQEDLAQFDDLVKSAHGQSITLAERPELP